MKYKRAYCARGYNIYQETAVIVREALTYEKNQGTLQTGTFSQQRMKQFIVDTYRERCRVLLTFPTETVPRLQVSMQVYLCMKSHLNKQLASIT